VTLIHHPDVRRMLATMRALTEASRALAYVAAAHSDFARRHPDDAVRARHHARYEFLVPVVKGWSTELAVEVASLGVQVHGGMGFIEETGAAQFYRDARILPIYEGTTAIQANDFVARKTLRDGGAVAKALLADVGATLDALAAHDAAGSAAFAAMREHLARGRDAFASAVDYVLANAQRDPNAVFAGSVPYLKRAGIVLGGWQMARALIAAQRLKDDDPKFCGAKIATAQFYAQHVLPLAVALEAAIVGANGRDGVLALSEDQF